MNVIRAIVALFMFAVAQSALAQDVAVEPNQVDPVGLNTDFGIPGLEQPDLVFEDVSSSNSVVDITTEWSIEKARPGDQRAIAVIFDMDEHWHINADRLQAKQVADFKPIPVTVDVNPSVALNSGLSDVATFEQAAFPKASYLAAEFANGEKIAVYEGRAIVFVPVKIREDAKPGEYTVTLSIGFQACDDKTCKAPVVDKQLSVTLTIVAPDESIGAAGTEEIFANYDAQVNTVRFEVFRYSFELNTSGTGGLILLWLVAALGGFLLNLTPCVLPVIPIKIIGLSQAAGNRGKCFVLGLTMSIGVLAFWLVLGTLIATVSEFTAANQLFQYPAFTIGVGAVIAAMAVGMCGLFAVRLPQFVYRINPKHDSLAGSFGFGVMTAVLSTPCTAPFMGAAAAWAATRSAAVTMTTFLCIGGGMALPYLVLSAFPALVNKMPRTGPASELIKQVMGVLMLAAAAYFIGTGLSGLLANAPDPPTKLYWWPVMLLVMAAGGWLTWRTIKITSNITPRAIFTIVGVLFVAGGAYGGVKFTAKGPIDWTYYTQERFDQALAEGKVIVLDFTAEWCINCKTLEHTQLHQQKVVDLLEHEGVEPIKIDITGANPAGRAKMQEVNTLTIPLLMVYAPDGSIIFRSDTYLAEQVVDAINEAGISIDQQELRADAVP